MCVCLCVYVQMYVYICLCVGTLSRRTRDEALAAGAARGRPGDDLLYRLELKIIADFGLVGTPPLVARRPQSTVFVVCCGRVCAVPLLFVPRQLKNNCEFLFAYLCVWDQAFPMPANRLC